MDIPGSMAVGTVMQLELYLADLRGRIEVLRAEERQVTERLAEEYAAIMKMAARQERTSGVSRW